MPEIKIWYQFNHDDYTTVEIQVEGAVHEWIRDNIYLGGIVITPEDKVKKLTAGMGPGDRFIPWKYINTIEVSNEMVDPGR